MATVALPHPSFSGQLSPLGYAIDGQLKRKVRLRRLGLSGRRRLVLRGRLLSSGHACRPPASYRRGNHRHLQRAGRRLLVERESAAKSKIGGQGARSLSS